uniref:Uncharacterized protein n=1 Tax=viral metagenome TaxID=1070528 RepID=A0A6C0BN93_9ZZZZ
MNDLLSIALDELDTLINNYYLILSDIEGSTDNTELLELLQPMSNVDIYQEANNVSPLALLEQLTIDINNKREYINRLISLGATPDRDITALMS